MKCANCKYEIERCRVCKKLLMPKQRIICEPYVISPRYRIGFVHVHVECRIHGVKLSKVIE